MKLDTGLYPPQAFFALYDGHAGYGAVEFCLNHMVCWFFFGVFISYWSCFSFLFVYLFVSSCVLFKYIAK